MTGHIWELGGGTHLTKLIEIPINPDTIQSLTIVLVSRISLMKCLKIKVLLC